MTKEEDMEEINIRRLGSLIIALFAAILSLPSTAADQKGKQGTAGDIIFNLTIRQPIVCLRPDAELELALEIKNGGSSTISVEDRAAFYMTNFRWIVLSDNEPERTLNSIGDPMPNLESPPKMILLKPGESFSKTVNYKLKGDFFSREGIYSMQLTYGAFADKPANLFKGSLDSNEVLFQLTECVVQSN
jgi:hypothetical protein